MTDDLLRSKEDPQVDRECFRPNGGPSKVGTRPSRADRRLFQTDRGPAQTDKGSFWADRGSFPMPNGLLRPQRSNQTEIGLF